MHSKNTITETKNKRDKSKVENVGWLAAYLFNRRTGYAIKVVLGNPLLLQKA